jgi:hypothetical protein
VRNLKLAMVLAFALAIAGCAAPTQRLSDADRGKIKSVAINPTVQKVPEPFLLAPSGANIGLMFGAVGGLAASGPIASSQNAFSAYLVKNSISVEAIVRQEVEQALRESGKIAVVAPGNPSTPSVNITVQQYGFGVPHLLSSNVVPVLMIKCDMVDGSGKVLWSAGDRMLPSVASPIESTSWEAMRDNPKVIEEQWRKASRLLAKKIVAEL